MTDVLLLIVGLGAVCAALLFGALLVGGCRFLWTRVFPREEAN